MRDRSDTICGSFLVLVMDTWEGQGQSIEITLIIMTAMIFSFPFFHFKMPSMIMKEHTRKKKNVCVTVRTCMIMP